MADPTRYVPCRLISGLTCVIFGANMSVWSLSSQLSAWAIPQTGNMNKNTHFFIFHVSWDGDYPC